MVFPTTYTTHLNTTAPFPIPQKPIAESVKTNNLIYTADSGYEQRRKKSAPRRTFELTFPLLDRQAYETLQTFFLQAGGNLESFAWTHPVTKTSYVVRFDQDTLQGEYFLTTTHMRHYWKVAVKLIQVL